MNEPKTPDCLTGYEWPPVLRAPDPELLEKLYIPALSCAVRYDRCCAYFSSSVLAAAARGFAQFIENLLVMNRKAPKPAIRLLVNEQLSEEDRDALLLRKDISGLEKLLLKKLITPKEALERQRLEMVAWMVKHGLLEVKVGIMRNTGGILHAKIGVVTDAENNVLLFRGSGNESAAAILQNYELLEVNGTWDRPELVQFYRNEFEQMWQGEHPEITTVPLPEAVKEKLLRFVPQEPPLAEPGIDSEEIKKIAMSWQYVAALPYTPEGEVALNHTAFVKLWPHQLGVVERTVRQWPRGFLLCDEVGMGKTIEAVMILRRLRAGRGVKRALLLVPAGLLRQWQGELREKGGTSVPIFEKDNLIFPDGTAKTVSFQQALQQPLLLVSREFARLDENRRYLFTVPPWDLVLLDEAHAARRKEIHNAGAFNSANLLLQMLRELQLSGQAKSFLLLSATPMQTDPWEPWDLVAVLGVGYPWNVDFEEVAHYYLGLSHLRNGIPSNVETQTIVHLVCNDVEFSRFHEDGAAVQLNEPELKNRLRFASSIEKDKLVHWLRSGSPLDRRMHRNTRDTLVKYYERGLINYRPPRRDVRDITFDFQSSLEKHLYQAVADYVNNRYDRLEAEEKGKGFVMTIYRRRAMSSPRALEESLKRRLANLKKFVSRQAFDFWSEPEFETVQQEYDEDEEIWQISRSIPGNVNDAREEISEIEDLLNRINQLGNVDSKFDRFLAELEKVIADGRSVLVFTEYTDTMDYLREQLRPIYGKSVACYSGREGELWDEEKRQWVGVLKTYITDALQNHAIRILLCTDAASEGLNLQAAGGLLNYDLPWNPSRIEQRIGRIDRIGQEHEILPIRNFFVHDSIDMRVYEVLRRRCGLFEHFVGPMQPVLAQARSILKQIRPPEEEERSLQELQDTIDDVEQNVYAQQIYEPHETGRESNDKEIFASGQLAVVIEKTANLKILKIQPVKNKSQTWKIWGIGRSAITVSLSAEIIEADRQVEPLLLGHLLVEQIAKKLRQHALYTPLITAFAQQGAFSSAAVRWYDPSSNRLIPVKSYAHLAELLQAWDGKLLPAEKYNELRSALQKKTDAQVKSLSREVVSTWKQSLDKQVEAAKERLRRELGRTLLCLDEHGDLNTTFHRYMQKESAIGDLLKQSFRRLRDQYPVWQLEELDEFQEYVRALRQDQLQMRQNIAPQLRAALDDPRWKALGTI